MGCLLHAEEGEVQLYNQGVGRGVRLQAAVNGGQH